MIKQLNSITIALYLIAGGFVAGTLPVQAAEDTLAVVAANACGTVWSDSIARLRIYDQPATTGNRVFVYRTPGFNADYVGNSDDPNVIKALYLARDNGRVVTGYTNAACTIEWLDY